MKYGGLRPIVSQWGAVSADLYTEISDALAGSVTPSQALSKAAQEADALLAKQQLVAAGPPGARSGTPAYAGRAQTGRARLIRPRTTNGNSRGRPRTTYDVSRGRSVGRRPLALAYLFIAPAVLLTATFSLLPLGMLAWRSLFSGGVFATKLSFVGLGNYSDALSQGGTQALQVTAIYTVGFVVLTMGFGLAIALLLDVKLPGVRHLRAPFIIPLVVPSVATALDMGQPLRPRFRYRQPRPERLRAPSGRLHVVAIAGLPDRLDLRCLAVLR